MAEDFMAMYKQALERLSTGGMSLEASLQEIEEGKKQAIAGGQQALVSGGMGGTTVMGGVPIQAEKIAGRQRLGARGRAEEKYLTTLASFAAFAQRGEEAAKQREFEARQSYLGRQSQEAMQIRGMQAPLQGSRTYGASGFPDMFSIPGERLMGGGGQAQQFPSLYGQETQVPDWTGGAGVGGTADTPWPTAAPLFKEQEELGIGQPTAAAPAPEQPAGVPTSLATGAQMGRMLGQPAAQGYSPGDTYVGGSMKDGVTTSYYRTKTGKIVPGPTYKG